MTAGAAVPLPADVTCTLITSAHVCKICQLSTLSAITLSTGRPWSQHTHLQGLPLQHTTAPQCISSSSAFQRFLAFLTSVVQAAQELELGPMWRLSFWTKEAALSWSQMLLSSSQTNPPRSFGKVSFLPCGLCCQLLLCKRCRTPSRTPCNADIAAGHASAASAG